MRDRHPTATVTNVDELWVMKLGQSKAESRVDNLFCALTESNSQRLHQLHICVQETQCMLDTDPEATALLDPWVFGHFEDLALLSELQQRIISFRPWSGGWKKHHTATGRHGTEGVSSLLRLEDNLVFTLKSCVDVPIEAPSSACWQYPADKTPTEQRINQMRHAEDHLNWFWDGAEEWVVMLSGLKLSRVLKKRTLQPRTLIRTLRWMQPVRKISPQPASLTESFAFGGSTGCPESQLRNWSTSKPKVKVKTRGAPSEGAVMLQRVADEAEAVRPHFGPTKTFQVSRRTHQTLSGLLPLPSAEHHHRSEVS